MKFGQRIKSEEAACLAGHRIELADHFLDYKVCVEVAPKLILYCCGSDVSCFGPLQKLKKIMKSKRHRGSDEEQPIPDDTFKIALMTEIDKVDAFFAAREAEYWYNFFIKLYPRVLEVIFFSHQAPHTCR